MNNLSRTILLAIIAVFVSLSISAQNDEAIAAYTVEDIPNVHLQNRTKYVSNPDGILSAQTVAQADTLLAQIWRTSATEVVAVVINDFDGDDIDLFANDLYDRWGIGKKDKDNGLLILIAKDRRKVVLRTGYGLEGVITDATAGRIIRRQFAPSFKVGDYDGGFIAGVKRINEILTEPAVIDEIKSGMRNDAGADDESAEAFFHMFLYFIGGLTIVWIVVYIAIIAGSRKLSLHEQYYKLDGLKVALIVSSCLTFGLTLIVLLPMLARMKRLRNKTRVCLNCGSKMKKLDEETDNLYLTPAQDAEEKINSVDYDVWLCPTCNSTEILPYVNKSKNYTVCERCGARAKTLVSDRVVQQPTVSSPGLGVKTYVCLNCHDNHQEKYDIEQTESSAAPIIFGAALGAASGRGGGFGGGFSGGSFGGGMTGGGGASGGW